MQLDLLCQRIGMEGNRLYAGKTINVSTGGVFFHLVDCKISRDDLLNVELTVPPPKGCLNLAGRVSTFARVVRVSPSVPIQIHIMPLPRDFWSFRKLVE